MPSPSQPAPKALPGRAVRAEAGERQCGRCRLFFPGDPSDDPTTLAEWWACQPCREALFGPSSTGGEAKESTRSTKS
jgi:hypothetical protein